MLKIIRHHETRARKFKFNRNLVQYIYIFFHLSTHCAHVTTCMREMLLNPHAAKQCVRLTRAEKDTYVCRGGYTHARMS